MDITLMIVTVYIAGLTTGWTLAWSLKDTLKRRRSKQKTAARKRVKA